MNYFAYDAMLRRFAVQESSGVSYFTWDQNGMNLLCERDASGSVTAYYTHGYTPVDGIGSLVAAKRNEAGASYYQYPIYDHRGSVVRLLDENGAATAYFEYDAWGSQFKDQVLSGTATNRFRYQSNWIELEDSGGDLYLSPTRVYHAGVGRFLGRDRAYGAAGGYKYGQNSPPAKADPDGRRVLWVGCIKHTFHDEVDKGAKALVERRRGIVSHNANEFETKVSHWYNTCMKVKKKHSRCCISRMIRHGHASAGVGQGESLGPKALKKLGAMFCEKAEIIDFGCFAGRLVYEQQVKFALLLAVRGGTYYGYAGSGSLDPEGWTPPKGEKLMSRKIIKGARIETYFYIEAQIILRVIRYLDTPKKDVMGEMVDRVHRADTKEEKRAIIQEYVERYEATEAYKRDRAQRLPIETGVAEMPAFD